MGAALSASLAASLIASGLSLDLIFQLLNPLGSQAVVKDAVRIAVADGIDLVFFIAFAAALLALIVTFLAPRQNLQDQPMEEDLVPTSMD